MCAARPNIGALSRFSRTFATKTPSRFVAPYACTRLKKKPPGTGGLVNIFDSVPELSPLMR